MLIEIPDPDVIAGVIVAFFVGLFGLFLYYKLKPFINIKPQSADPSYMERLEYYERQLIDMKIRLDALEMEDLGTNSDDSMQKVREIVTQLTSSNKERAVAKQPKTKKQEPEVSQNYRDVTDHVLGLITEKPMTSRDIQITLGRSREHTARLMKKLFDDGFVIRNTSTKPYTYSITEKGKEKLGVLQNAPTTA